MPRRSGIEQWAHQFDTASTRALWSWLVDYTNASDDEFTNALKNLKKAIFRSLRWVELNNARSEAADLEDIQELASHAEEFGGTLEQAFEFFASMYQHDFRRLLTWLSAPNEHQELGDAAVQFLNEHDKGLRSEGFKVNPKFDPDGKNGGYPVLFWRDFGLCRSIMSPICKFIIERADRFQQNGELTLKEAIPIRRCERRECGKLVVPERQKERCFCSDAYRAADWQSKKAAEWKAEKMREWRKHPKTKIVKRKNTSRSSRSL